MPNNQPDPSKKGGESLRYADLGWRMLAITAGSAAIGWFLDKYFDTKPWLTLFLSVLGVFGAMYMIIREALRKK